MAIRIGILGAGAIGCVVGGLLTKAGHDVTLMDQWPEHVETLKRQGLRLSGTCGDHQIAVKALHLHEMQRITQPFDAVFVAVKSYDTEWATALGLAYLARPDGVVVDFQNGINDERVAAVAGRARTLGCVILIAAGMYEAGHAMRTDAGHAGFKIGELDGRDTPRARALAEMMSVVAPTSVTTNLFGVDATLRWKPLSRSIYHSFVGRSEVIWSRRQQFNGRQDAMGYYASGDYQFARRWFAGVRYDRSDRADDASLLDKGGSATLTYWPSEFSQVRGQYRRTDYADGPAANELLFQFQFSIGAHGAHPF